MSQLDDFETNTLISSDVSTLISREKWRASSEGEDAFGDLLSQNLILEFLLTKHLSALLSASHQVWHDLLSRAKRHILVDFVAVLSELSSHLIGETSELSEADSLVLFAPKVIDK